jgi:hypothetical protein
MDEVKSLSKQEKRDKKRALQVAAGLRPPKVSKRKRGLQATKVKDKTDNNEDNSVPSRIPSEWLGRLPKNRLLREDDELYDEVMKRSYTNFVIEPKGVATDEKSEQFHTDFQRALKDIGNYYDYDLVQPLGLNTPLASTKVKRCLIGVPGTTYKYLGLRMFALPFSDDKGPFRLLKRCNEEMKQRTQKLLLSRRTHHGGADYDILLINKCFSSASSEQVKLKPEPMFKEELASVSWHADSMLQPFSSIGVYNFVAAEQTGESIDGDWRIGLRVTENIEGPSKKQRGFKSNPTDEEGTLAPPVSVKAPSESIYYLLGSFNHHHEHCVLAGHAQERYSSTHRCARHGHTYETINGRAKLFLGKKRKLENAKYVAHLISIASEIEFEWLRQWYIQGRAHAELRKWWHTPMETLLHYWGSLQDLISKGISLIKNDDSSYSKSGASDTLLSLITGLDQIMKLREGWRQREMDPIFDRMDAGHKPIPFPAETVDYNDSLSHLRSLIETK